MIYAEPEGARRRAASQLIAYMLHEGPQDRVLFAAGVNLVLGLAGAADEIERTIARALVLSRRGRKTERGVLHFVLSWHPDDRPTTEHMAETARSALDALRLREHQAVIVGHDDTGKLHARVAVNVIHPVTGKAAKLGWRWRTMSRWAAAYESEQGVIRCMKRHVPKAVNENRKRLRRSEWDRQNREAEEPKASLAPAPRP